MSYTNIRMSVYATTRGGVQVYFPDVNFEDFMESIEAHPTDPSAICFTVDGVKYPANPSDVNLGMNLETIFNIYQNLPESTMIQLEDMVNEFERSLEPPIKVVPDPAEDDKTDCEACSCEKYLVGGEDDGREED